jgi:uncharacterized membrane protein (UPF0127 family)
MTEDRRQMTNGVVRGRRFFVLGLLSLVICLWSRCVIAEETSQICFKDYCFTIEVADTPEKQMRGLMFRESMPDGHGMLFLFPTEQTYSFWMKNTLIPLDIIWMDKDMKIVHIESHVMPCENDPCPSYSPPVSAQFVLELNADMAAENKLFIGDQGSVAKIDRWGALP